MIGTTGVRGLQVDCIVGIHPHERNEEQTVLVDVEIDYDLAPPAASDAIADAADYDMVVWEVTQLCQTRRFFLIETMAEAAATMLLAQVPQASTVRVEVRKPAAVPRAEHSFVRVERTRQ